MIARAVASPMPGRSIRMRYQLTSSRGFSSTRRNASTSFTCAASRNLRPPHFSNGILPIGELDLEIGRHVAGAEEHGDLAQRRAFLVQLEDAIDDELRLLLLVARGHEPRRLAARALGPEILRESLGGARDQRVRDVEDRLRRAIVLLERHDRRAGELLREIEDVAEVRAAERVDALRVVADDGDVLVRRGTCREGCAPAGRWCPGTRRRARGRRGRRSARASAGDCSSISAQKSSRSS